MLMPLILSVVSPHGRLPRGAWLSCLVALSVTFLAFGMLAVAVSGNDGAVIVALVYLWCTCALSVRRLHDISRSGYSLLTLLIPLIGPLWVLLVLLRPGVDGPNRYGEDPLSRLDYLRVDTSK